MRVEVRPDGGQEAGGKMQGTRCEVLTVEPMALEEMQALMV